MPQLQLKLHFPDENRKFILELMRDQYARTGWNYVSFEYISRYIREWPGHNLKTGNDGLIRDLNRISRFGDAYVI